MKSEAPRHACTADLAPMRGETRELLRERPIFSRGYKRNLGPFPIPQENLDYIRNRDAPWLRFFSRLRSGRHHWLTVPRVAASHVDTRTFASSRSDLLVCLRVNVPPSVPEA